MRTTVSLSLTLAAAALPAQGGLLFTTRAPEQSAQCPALAAINRVDPNEVEYVVPGAGPFTAKAFTPRVAYDLMFGDADGDASYVEPALFRGIDALLPPVRTAGPIPPNSRRLWFSPAANTPAIAGGTLLAGDIGRVLPGGVIERFISEAMINAAFGITAPGSLNVDAAALHLPTGLYLSFEDTETIFLATGAVSVADGAIVRIPAAAIAWGVSPYDGALRVTGVAAGSGQLVASEPFVDTWVVGSGIDDNAGAPLAVIGDTDGLEIDPQGGIWSSPFLGAPVPNLWLSGLSLTGGGVITTNGGGAIALLNGVPLGNAAGATSGAQVGLVPAVPVLSLNGLALTHGRVEHFTTETPTPQILAPGPLTIEVGGVEPAAGGAFLFVRPGVVGPLGVDASLAFPSIAFPDLYVNVFLAPVAVGADGCGSWSIPITAAMLGGLGGNRISFQAWYFFGSHRLSTPLAVQFF